MIRNKYIYAQNTNNRRFGVSSCPQSNRYSPTWKLFKYPELGISHAVLTAYEERAVQSGTALPQYIEVLKGNIVIPAARYLIS